MYILRKFHKIYVIVTYFFNQQGSTYFNYEKCKTINKFRDLVCRKHLTSCLVCSSHNRVSFLLVW